MSILMIFWAFIATSYAQESTDDYQVIQIYVDLTEIHAPDGTKGTSVPLNVMMARTAQKTSILEHRMQRHTGAEIWNGEINVYDWQNVMHMPSYKQCDYSNAIKCGIQNNHWTLRTVVSVGKKFSVFTVYLYDEKGLVIASSSKTAWGTIRWHPQWKITQIKEQGPFGAAAKEIFEQWPPRMEELPPLITPHLIGQTNFGFYWIRKSACKVKACK